MNFGLETFLFLFKRKSTARAAGGEERRKEGRRERDYLVTNSPQWVNGTATKCD